MNANTSGLDAFLPRVRPDEAGAEAEEAAERAWIAHVQRGHETWVRPPVEPPIYAHPTHNGKPISDTRLWAARKR